MQLSIETRQIPNLITWFNSFIGFRNIQKRIERVETKLRDLEFKVPALNRRYYFHLTYKQIVVRNRTFRKIDVDDFNTNRVISLLAAIREFSKLLSEAQKIRLCARIIGSLDPDHDIREFEHEMR